MTRTTRTKPKVSGAEWRDHYRSGHIRRGLQISQRMLWYWSMRGYLKPASTGTYTDVQVQIIAIAKHIADHWQFRAQLAISVAFVVHALWFDQGCTHVAITARGLRRNWTAPDLEILGSEDPAELIRTICDVDGSCLMLSVQPIVDRALRALLLVED